MATKNKKSRISEHTGSTTLTRTHQYVRIITGCFLDSKGQIYGHTFHTGEKPGSGTFGTVEEAKEYFDKNIDTICRKNHRRTKEFIPVSKFSTTCVIQTTTDQINF